MLSSEKSHLLIFTIRGPQTRGTMGFLWEKKKETGLKNLREALLSWAQSKAGLWIKEPTWSRDYKVEPESFFLGNHKMKRDDVKWGHWKPLIWPPHGLEIKAVSPCQRTEILPARKVRCCSLNLTISKGNLLDSLDNRKQDFPVRKGVKAP